MDLILNDEQKLLRDSAAKFVERRAGGKLVRKVRQSDKPYDPDTWREMADAGWLAIMVPDESDGLGLGMTELALTLIEAGKSILPGPVAATAASARILAECPNAQEFGELVTSIIEGSRIISVALQEKPFSFGSANIDCRAEKVGKNWRLTGKKIFIPEAGAADGFLVSAQSLDGPLVCFVPVDTIGCSLHLTSSVDGGDSGTLVLEQVLVTPEQLVAGPNQAEEICTKLTDLTITGLSAELLGVMEAALEMSVDYIKIRTQFDQPIGKFQALQHQAVNDYVDVELTRSLLFQVSAMVDRNEDISALASALKAKASGAALRVTKSAIQLHGAVGVSDEHDIGLYLKRAIALSTYYGNEMAHRRRFAALSGLEQDA